MQRKLILIALVITAVLLVVFGSALAALSVSINNIKIVIAIVCGFFVLLLFGHWLLTGCVGFIAWFKEKKAGVICIFAVFFTSFYLGIFIGEVFYLTLFMIVPLVITNGVIDYRRNKREAAMYFGETDYEKIAEYDTYYKCNKCNGAITEVIYDNPAFGKKTEYKCNDCGQVYNKKNLRKN